MNIPLSERLRPDSLDEVIGQKHLVGKGGPLRSVIENGKISSMIFWGPPGVGKTTLSKIIAKSMDMPHYALSAVESGVKEVRGVINAAKMQGGAILFIDEIHRFSKAQQDTLLGAVEQGVITLIGATTENPSFEVISALLSRSQVYILEPLSKEDLVGLLEKAIHEDEELSKKKIELKEVEALLKLSGGDARRLLNILELVVHSFGVRKAVITNEAVEQVSQQKLSRYDKKGENHYDIASALIKSIRGSDPNAAIYWLARMIDGGEDPKFIARRLIISASEDIGNANPTALVIANNCFQAVSVIGYPECRITLAQAVTYLASSDKSSAAYDAINEALSTVKKTGDLEVPIHLRNAPTKLMKDLDYGQDYKYPHAFPSNFVEQEYMPKELKGTAFYRPQSNPREQGMLNRLKSLWKNKYSF